MAILSLNTNLSSLKTQRKLAQSTSALSKTYERLSSGLRVSRASDDAAGMAIASGLNVDSRIFSQGLRNLSDGVSITNIAEGALNELTNIVLRLQELAEQAANGTLGTKQRSSLDAEAQALSEEYFRIARTAEFNGRKLFDGSVQGLSLQAGYGVNGSIQSTIGNGLGTGSFSSAVTCATDLGSTWGGSNAVSLGDLNGDGILDLVTAGYSFDGANYQGQVSVLFGSADGTFGARTTYATHYRGRDRAVALGDLNGDGILDIVTAGDANNGGGIRGQASVLLGRGDGTFGASVTYSTETGSGLSRSNGVTLGDLNGDGILDLVTAGYANNGSTQGQASVLLGRGDGTFGARVTYATNTGSTSGKSFAVTLGDLNRDGILDLVTAGTALNGAAGQGEASVRFGQGDGTFGAKISCAMDTGSSTGGSLAVSLGDLNGDGILDLVSAGYANNGSGDQGQASLRLGNGDGTFGGRATYSTSTGSLSARSRAVTLGDLNGDGILDLVSAGYANNGSNQGRANVFLGNGDGTFGASATYATDTGSVLGKSRAAALGDVNRDGILDLVTAGESNSGSSQGQASILLALAKEGLSPLLDFSLKTKTDAKWALELMKQKLTQLSQQRGIIGANQSRISTAIANLQVERENYDAARSQITDVDVASESAALVKTQILQQGAAAVLGQANQAPALALKLLGV